MLGHRNRTRDGAGAGRRRGRRAPGLALLAVLVIILSACSTRRARVDQFERFALAGVQFADAIPVVLDESFEVKVATSSLVLVVARPGLDEDARLSALSEDDAELARRLAILNDLKRHARVLGTYFKALQALARADSESTGLTDVTGGILQSLAPVSSRIAGATVAGRGIGEILPPVARFAFGSFQSRALETELRRSAPTVERELALQHAALEIIAEAMQADLEAQAAARDRDSIELPYARSGPLPADWSQRRLDSFRRRIRISSVEAAMEAAGTLRSCFVALVEGQPADALLGALVKDITEILAFAESATNNP